MPILEYLCEICAHQFEIIVQGSQVPMCPACHSAQLEKRLSIFAVGSKSTSLTAEMPVGACGACGDPRGPGACAVN